MEHSFLSKLVSDMTRTGALLDLNFTNREGLVGDVLVRGYLKHTECEVIKFSILDEKMRSINKISAVGLRREDQPLLDADLESICGSSPSQQRDLGRIKILQERILEGTGADHSCVPKDEPTGKMTGLDGQGTFEGTQGEIKGVSPLERGKGNPGNV